jgi:hypothetical protein
MSQVSKDEVLQYLDDNWDSNNQIVKATKTAYARREDDAGMRLVNSILEAVFGIFGTPTNILKNVWLAVVAFLSKK